MNMQTKLFDPHSSTTQADKERKKVETFDTKKAHVKRIFKSFFNVEEFASISQKTDDSCTKTSVFSSVNRASVLL